MEPFLNFFISFVYNDLQITIGSNHTVDGSHQPRKDTDTQELYHHLKVIFHDGVALKVSISDGGERGNNPINGGDIKGELVVLVDGASLVTIRVVWPLSLFDPTAHGKLCERYPKAAKKVNGLEHVQEHIEDIVHLESY